MVKKFINKLLKGDARQIDDREGCIDFDRYDCIKCDDFVSSVNNEGLCLECAEAEKHEAELWVGVN